MQKNKKKTLTLAQPKVQPSSGCLQAVQNLHGFLTIFLSPNIALEAFKVEFIPHQILNEEIRLL